MKLPAIPSTLVTNGATANLTTMTSKVNEAAARRLIEMTVNLYADPILAACRECIANAIDATRRAGSKQPVEVTAPSILEPHFIVTDHGTGMSVTEVEDAFLAFASSTKTDTNDEIGGLGVGAKSPWTIAESFLVDTVKDGKRTIVRASRDLTHQVMMAGEETDLPNGTTISIPVPNFTSDESSKWHRRIMEVATAHDEGTVTVNGKPVNSIASGSTRIGPVLCTRVAEHGTSVVIRSGGTLFDSVYAVTNRARQVVKLAAFVIELPIGSFDHTPSRESVVSSERTLAAIDAALEQYQTSYDALTARLDALAATDLTAAVKLRESVLGDVGDYEVLPINAMIQVPAGIGAWVGGKRWEQTGKDGTNSSKDTFNATGWAGQADRTILVTDVPAGRKLRGFATYVKNTHSNVRRILPIPAGSSGVTLEVTDRQGKATGQTFTIDATMVPENNVYTFDRWLEVTATQRTERGPLAGYKVVVVAQDGDKPVNREMSAAEIAAAGLPVWYDTADSQSLPLLPKASIGVHLERRKTGPLLKAVPAAMTAGEWHRKCYAGEINALTPMLRLALAAESSSYVERRFILAAQAREQIVAQGRISPPLLNRVAEIAAVMETLTDAQKRTWIALRSSGARTEVAAAREEVENLDGQITSAWPLMRHAYSYSRGDDADYVAYMATMPPKS